MAGKRDIKWSVRVFTQYKYMKVTLFIVYRKERYFSFLEYCDGFFKSRNMTSVFQDGGQ